MIKIPSKLLTVFFYNIKYKILSHCYLRLQEKLPLNPVCLL